MLETWENNNENEKLNVEFFETSELPWNRSSDYLKTDDSLFWRLFLNFFWYYPPISSLFLKIETITKIEIQIQAYLLKYLKLISSFSQILSLKIDVDYFWEEGIGWLLSSVAAPIKFFFFWFDTYCVKKFRTIIKRLCFLSEKIFKKTSWTKYWIL